MLKEEDEIYAATSLMKMKTNDRQQRYHSTNNIQLPPLCLTLASTSPRFDCYSSSSFNSSCSSDYHPTVYTPPSSSMRHSFNTPSPTPTDVPVPIASGHCFEIHQTRHDSYSPGGSSCSSAYRAHTSSYRDYISFPPPPLRQHHESPTLRLSSMASCSLYGGSFGASPVAAVSHSYDTACFPRSKPGTKVSFDVPASIKQKSLSPTPSSQREDSLGPYDVTFTADDTIEAERVVVRPPPSPPRKVRSSLHSPNRSQATTPRKPKIRLTRKSKVILHQQQLADWHLQLDSFLRCDQAYLLSSRAGTILTTLASSGQAVTTTSTVKANSKTGASTISRSRGTSHGAISTHRFVLPINVESNEWHLISQAASIASVSDEMLANHGCYYISCVRWERELWITNSDICHIVKFRMEVLGFQVIDREKLFEGVYSDLRVVSKHDYRYEEAKGAFLNALDELGCISMHKRQKLYKWSAVPHQQLFTSAIRRSVLNRKSCKPIRQPALRLCSGEDSIESILS